MNRKQQIFSKCLDEMTPSHLKGLAKIISEGVSIIEAAKEKTSNQMDLFAGADDDNQASETEEATEPVTAVTTDTVESEPAAVEPVTEPVDELGADAKADADKNAAENEARSILYNLRELCYAVGKNKTVRIYDYAEKVKNQLDTMSDAAAKIVADNYAKDVITQLKPGATKYDLDTLKNLVDDLTMDLSDYDPTGGLYEPTQYLDDAYDYGYRIEQALDYFDQNYLKAVDSNNPERIQLFGEGYTKLLEELEHLEPKVMVRYFDRIGKAIETVYAKLGNPIDGKKLVNEAKKYYADYVESVKENTDKYGDEFDDTPFDADKFMKPLNVLRGALLGGGKQFYPDKPADMLFELGIKETPSTYAEDDDETRSKTIAAAVSEISTMGGADIKKLSSVVNSMAAANRNISNKYDTEYASKVFKALADKVSTLDANNLNNANQISIGAAAQSMLNSINAKATSATFMDDIKAEFDRIMNGYASLDDTYGDVDNIIQRVKSAKLTPNQAKELATYVDGLVEKITSGMNAAELERFKEDDPIWKHLITLRYELSSNAKRVTDIDHKTLTSKFNVDSVIQSVYETNNTASLMSIRDKALRDINAFVDNLANEGVKDVIIEDAVQSLKDSIEGLTHRIKSLEIPRKDAIANYYNKNAELSEYIANGDMDAQKELTELRATINKAEKDIQLATHRRTVLENILTAVMTARNEQGNRIDEKTKETQAEERRRTKELQAAAEREQEEANAMNKLMSDTWGSRFNKFRSEADSVVDYNDETYNNPNDIGVKGRINDRVIGNVTANKIRKDFEASFDAVASSLTNLKDDRKDGIIQLFKGWTHPDSKYQDIVRTVVAGKADFALPGFNKNLIANKFMFRATPDGTEYLAYNAGGILMPIQVAKELIRGEYETSVDLGESKSTNTSVKPFGSLNGARFYNGDNEIENFGDSLNTYGGTMSLLGGEDSLKDVNDEAHPFIGDFIKNASDDATKGNNPDIAKYVSLNHTDNITHKYPKVWHIKENTKKGESRWGVSVEFDADSQNVTITNDVGGGEPVVIPVKGMAGMLGNASLEKRIISKIMQPMFDMIAADLNK